MSTVKIKAVYVESEVRIIANGSFLQDVFQTMRLIR